jgi:hypothetical protein
MAPQEGLSSVSKYAKLDDLCDHAGTEFGITASKLNCSARYNDSIEYTAF